MKNLEKRISVISKDIDETLNKEIKRILEKANIERNKILSKEDLRAEEEIKKIAQIAGADELTIFKEKRMLERMNFIENPKTIINYTVYSEDENKLKTIGRELKGYLGSKGFEAVIVILEFTDIPTETEWLTGSIVTSADLNFFR